MSTRPLFSSLLAAAAVFLASAAGCSLLTKTDRSKLDDTSGSGGSAGAGGSTGTGGTTTPTGGGGGSGGALPCATECCSPLDCPTTDNECVQRTCTDGACGTRPVREGVPVSLQTAGDCKLTVCDGLGATVTVAQSSDLFDDGKACTIDKCQGVTPKNTNTPAGESCAENGGIKCDGSGACVACLAPSDCASKVCSIDGACLPPSCADGVKNGDETDTDCGGSCGATCKTGKPCKIAGDCVDKVCSGTPLVCAAPTCSDLLKNGNESDVDCGGSCGPSCAPNEACSKNADCKGNLCSGSFCLPSCSDGVLNNGEINVDCGGPVCDETCAQGATCFVASDCGNGFCIDGVCCESACNAACFACAAAKKSSGPDGECGPSTLGTDPHNDCNIVEPSTCGNATGVCNGFGTCEKYPAGTPCGDAASCAAGVQTNPDACNGSGVCANNGTTPCGLYACGATACNTTCALDADCAAGAYCGGTVCLAKKPIAAACAGSNQCQGGFCVDGLCCATACTAVCSACSVAAGGPANGACGPVGFGLDPAAECGATSVCNGSGTCKLTTGEPCALASDCANSHCVDGVCCDGACSALCQACSAAKTGGTGGTCADVAVGTDPDDECAGASTCAGASICSP